MIMKFLKPALFTLLLCLIIPLTAAADLLEDAKAAIGTEEFAKALELLQPLAEENNVEAQTLLGILHVNGQGVEKDFTKGLSLIMKAATQAYEPARVTAFKLCLELASQGDTSAMYNVGYMCLNDWGGDHDTAVCTKWLENAAQLGHEKSAKFLTKIYTDGMFGIAVDAEKAAHWKNLQAAFAAGVDGKWEGSLDMGMGGPPMVYSFDFKTDGDILTGTTLGFRNQKMPITDGTFDGTHISFSVKTNFGGMKSTTKYTGTFYGDTLQLTSETETSGGSGLSASKTLKKDTGGGTFPPVTFTVKRAG